MHARAAQPDMGRLRPRMAGASLPRRRHDVPDARFPSRGLNLR